MANPAPVLFQSVKWGEEYVSAALNKKFAGVIKPGIYRGYILAQGSEKAVRIEHGDKAPSVAVIERDGYSITAVMKDGGYVDIPAPGEWFICLECFYATNQPGYQRIVAREKVEPHHVVLGKVYMDDTGLIFTEDGRMDAEILTHMEVDEIKQEFAGELDAALKEADQVLVRAVDEMDCKIEEVIGILADKLAKGLVEANKVNEETQRLLEQAENINGAKNDIILSTNIIRVSNRITRLELLHEGYDWRDLPPAEIPLDPIEPENPDNPDTPDNPDNPQTPDNPDTPNNPDNPDTGNGCNCNCCGNSTDNRLFMEVTEIETGD